MAVMDIKGKGRAVDQDENSDGDDEATLNELEETGGFAPNGSSSSKHSYSRESEDDGNDEYDDASHPLRPGHRPRSSSLSSLAAFAFNALPIPASRETADPAERNKEVKHLDLVGGIALIVGLQVGSGIFSSPGILTADCGSVGAALCIWLGAGLLAWTGASSYAELGSAIPTNGGSQAYLRYAYGPLVSFLFSWTAIIGLKPASNAIISLIFAEYLCRIAYHTAFSASGAAAAEGVAAIPRSVIQLVAVLAISGIALMNAVSLKLGTRAGVFLTLLKLLALLAVAIMGLVQLGKGKASDSLRGNIFEGSSSSPGRYALALYSGLWAYDGWDQCCYVAGEMKNVSRNLPRAIHISVPLVIIMFLAANISYFIVLPKDLVSHSNTVGLDFGREMFGAVGGVLFAAIVAVSCFGAMNSSFFTSSRIIFVAAKEGYLPKAFSKLHITRKTPINSIILQAGFTYIMIAFGDFSSLVAFLGFSAWLFYLLTVLGLLILRHREPNLPRPYRTYLATPVTFCCVAAFLLSMPIFSAPLEALLASLFIASGLPVYVVTRTRTRAQRQLANMGLQGQDAPPPTRTERAVDFVRETLPERMKALLGRGKEGANGHAYASGAGPAIGVVGAGVGYEAVELEELDGDGGSEGLSRQQTRESLDETGKP